MSKNIKVDIAPGELIDKITILEIKAEEMSDDSQLANVTHELSVLTAIRDQEIPTTDALERLTSELKLVNEKLWQIEDDIRECEAAKKYDQKFIDLARLVYVTNDKRAALKREINVLLGSDLVEEKSYKPY